MNLNDKTTHHYLDTTDIGNLVKTNQPYAYTFIHTHTQTQCSQALLSHLHLRKAKSSTTLQIDVYKSFVLFCKQDLMMIQNTLNFYFSINRVFLIRTASSFLFLFFLQLMFFHLFYLHIIHCCLCSN